MNYTTPDPVSNQERVLVRQTASGFEQVVAGIIGLCTAGPVGALASWGAIKGLQGKWTPWALLGVVGAPVLLTVQLMTLGALVETVDTNSYDRYEEVREYEYR